MFKNQAADSAPWLFHSSLRAKFSEQPMVASDVASKHSHTQVLEVNNMVLRAFLGYLDFPCVCCIHTAVRMVGGRGALMGPSHIYKPSTACP